MQRCNITHKSIELCHKFEKPHKVSAFAREKYQVEITHEDSLHCHRNNVAILFVFPNCRDRIYLFLVDQDESQVIRT